jgi:two-component system OmpR family response regulator
MIQSHHPRAIGTTRQESISLIPISIEIVEGNPNLASLLGWHLQQIGYSVFQAMSCQQAKLVFQKQQPSLVVLSTELPDGDGVDLCRWLHKQKSCLVFIISSRIGEADIVEGLKAGADDYLTKPFGMQEFLARVEALTRRLRTSAPPACLDYGVLKIDLVQRQVRLKGNAIDLTPQEFSLLYVLAQSEGLALSRTDLLQRAWPDEINNPRTVDTHVLSLRKKLEVDPQQPNLIQTVRNIGYRFNPEALTRSPNRNNPQASPSGSNGSSDRPPQFTAPPSRTFAKY